MKAKTPATITNDQQEQYFEQAISWDEEIYRKERESKQRWRITAGVFAAISLSAVIALAGLTPLKTAVPYVIKVEKTTGIVEVLDPLEARTVEIDEAVSKHFIVQYLNAREQYSVQTREKNYITVGKMSSEKVFAEYRQQFDPDNPDSPLNLYGEDATVTCWIRGFAPINEDTYIVRIKRTVRRATELRESYWMVTLSFEYLMEPKTESDRIDNPLGFQVTAYSKNPEIMEEVEVKQ